jgi:hypothetical protein
MFGHPFGIPNSLMRRAILVTVAVCGAACSSSPSPAPVPSPTTCTLNTSMTFLSPSPSEGAPFVQYFASLIVSSQGAVYFVDVTTLPSGCFATWTVVPSNVNFVNVSPAGGNGRGRVELFMPPNPGAPRQTTVAIAGQVASILQAGR